MIYLRIIFLLFIFLFNANADVNIKIYTEQDPPHNMKINGKLTGHSVEILDAMFKEMHSKQKIEDIILTNWSRAYFITQRVPNTMVFSTTRTKKRENLFKWVGPVTNIRIGIIAPKNKHIKITKISDLNKYRIGAVLRDVGEQLLLQKGVNKDKIQCVNGSDAIKISFVKMKKNRIDMFAYNADVALAGAKRAGFDTSKYEVVYILDDKAQLYYAFNKKTDDKIIKKWQNALNTIKKNGIYNKITKKYK